MEKLRSNSAVPNVLFRVLKPYVVGSLFTDLSATGLPQKFLRQQCKLVGMGLNGNERYFEAHVELYGWGAVPQSSKVYGGRAIGVIQQFLRERELAYDKADELVSFSTMQERKLRIENPANPLSFLPWGMGCTGRAHGDAYSRSLYAVQNLIVFFNTDDFHDGLIALFQRIIR